MDNKRNEINSLPEGWVMTKLGNMVLDSTSDFVDGPFGSNLKANEYKDEGIPVFRIQNIKANQFIDKNIQYVSKEKAEELSRHTFKIGDLIVTKLGDPLGLCCKVPAKYPYGVIVADLMRIRLSKTIVFDDYLMNVINSKIVQDQFKRLTKGTTRPRVNLTIVRDIDIPLAPLPEQHRIVAKLDELLSELEKGKEQLELVQQKLKVYRQALLKAAFEGKLTEEWRKQQTNLKSPQQLIDEINQYRKEKYEKDLKDYEDGNVKIKPKKIEKLKITNDTVLNLPNNWIALNLFDVSNVLSGFAFKSNDFISDGVSVIKIGNVGYSEFHWKEQQYLPESYLIKYSEYAVQANDLLIALTRPITNNTLKTCFYPKDAKSGLLNQRVAIIKPEQFLNKDFLAYYFQSETFKKYIESKLSITLQPNLSPKDLELAKIPICSLEEQQFIVEELSTKLSYCNFLEENIVQKLSQIEPLKQSILQKAFSGQLVPQDPNDEPASVLLERIKKEREEYLKNQVKEKKTTIRKTKISMAEELKTIMQLLQESKKPIAAKALWQASEHKENIDEFYAELKVLIEKGEIKEAERKGKESFLTLANAK